MQRALTEYLDAARGPLIGAGVVAAFAVALFGTLRLGLPIWSLAIVALGCAYLFVTLQRPIVGLIAIICVFFVPLRLAAGISLLQAVGAGTAALILLWFLYNRRTLIFGTIQIPLVVLGVLILVSVWFSLDAAQTTFYLRRWVFNMMFVALMLNLVTDFDIFKRIVWAVILMAAVNSMAGLLDFASATDHNYRSMGLMENANSFGHLAALAFPLALYQYLYRRGTLRWIGLGLLCLLAGGVVASVSRGALLSVVLVTGVTMVRERKRILPMLLVVAIALSVTPLLPDYYRERVGNLATDIKNSVVFDSGSELTSRGYLNSAGLKIWSAHPIIGVGIGNFGRYYVQRDFAEELAGSEQTIAHNIYVQALAETGVVGAVVLLWLLLQSASGVVRAARRSEPLSDRWIYFRAVEMMALAIFISTASYGSLMNNDFWMFIGLTAIASRVAADSAAAKTSEEAAA